MFPTHDPSQAMLGLALRNLAFPANSSSVPS
jgi:hypothetical protein